MIISYIIIWLLCNQLIKYYYSDIRSNGTAWQYCSFEYTFRTIKNTPSEHDMPVCSKRMSALSIKIVSYKQTLDMVSPFAYAQKIAGICGNMRMLSVSTES